MDDWGVRACIPPVPLAPGEENGWITESDLILLPSIQVEVAISFVALGGAP